MDSFGSIKNQCRICLQKNRDIFSIFECRDSISIHEDVMFCTNISIKKGDNLPEGICSECFRELKISSQFKRKSEQSDLILRELIPSKENKIKDEFDSAASIENTNFSPANSDCDEDYKPLKSLIKKKKKIHQYHRREDLEHSNESVLNKDIKKRQEKQTRKKQKQVNILNKGDSTEFKCETCNLRCQSKWVLKVHMRTHSGERPFECEVCQKRFVSNSNMRMHKRLTHDEEKQVCSKCGKSFNCLTYLKRHQVVHLDVKPFGCALCPRRFTTASYLREHMARHRGDKKFFCEVCGTKFISDVNLKQHMVTHGVLKWDFKRHQCTFCEYRTTGRVALARHIRKHTGEKPFHCPHEGCQSSFAGKASLNLHIRIHTGEKPYSCSQCPSKFSRGDKFKNHMLKKHNINNVGPNKRSRLIIQELAVNEDATTNMPVMVH